MLVLSSKGTAPKTLVSAPAAAPETVECPERYSGNGGVGIVGSQLGSIDSRMYVRGRIRLYWNLYPHAAVNASASDTPVSAMSHAASSPVRCFSATIWLAIESQCPAGVPDSPPLSAQ